MGSWPFFPLSNLIIVDACGFVDTSGGAWGIAGLQNTGLIASID